MKESKLHGSEVATGEDDAVAARLREAEEAAKRNADKKGAEFHGEEAKQQAMKAKEAVEENGGRRAPAVGEKGVAGRKIMKGSEAVLKDDTNERDKEKETKPESEEEHKVKDELNDILKKSPSTFPHSPRR